MKTNTFLSVLFLVSLCAKAQKLDDVDKKNAFGLDLYSMNHQLTKFKPSFNGSFNPDYYGAHTNASTDYSLWYKREFKMDTSHLRPFLKVHFMWSYRYGDTQIDSSTDARVYEEFFRFPLLFGYKLSTGKSFAVNFSFGLVYSILSKQKYLARPNVTFPAIYQNEYGFGSYSKLGMAAEISATIHISKKTFFNVGFWADNDFSNPLKKSNDIPLTTVYRSFGMFVGFGSIF